MILTIRYQRSLGKVFYQRAGQEEKTKPPKHVIAAFTSGLFQQPNTSHAGGSSFWIMRDRFMRPSGNFPAPTGAEASKSRPV